MKRPLASWCHDAILEKPGSSGKSARYDASVETTWETTVMMTERPTAAATAKISPDDGSVEIQPEVVPYDASVVKNLGTLEKSKMNQPGHNLTIKARLFGHKLQSERGQTPKNLTMPVRPFLRSEKSA
jgi:hypothetical protein